MSDQSIANKKDMPKKGKIKNAFYVILLCVVIIFFVVISAAGWLVSTEKGLHLTVNWLKQSVQGLSIDNTSGRLIGPLSLKGLRLQTDSLNYSQQHLSLDWSPTKIFKRQIVIDYLIIKDVDVLTKSSPKENKKSEPIILPESIGLPFGFDIILTTIEINDIQIESNRGYIIDKVALQARSNNNRYQLEALSIDSDWLRLYLTTSLKDQTPFAISSTIDFTLNVDAFVDGDYAPINAAIELAGDIKQLQLKKNIQTPYNTNIDIVANNIFDTLYFDTNIIVENAVLNNISKTLPEYEISTALSVSGSPTLFNINTTGDIVFNNHSYLNYDMKAVNEAQKLTLTQFQLNPSLTPEIGDARVNVLGDINYGDKEKIVVDLNTDWKKIRWPLSTADEALLYSEQGRLDVTGSTEDIALTLNTAIGTGGALTGDIQGGNLLTDERLLSAELSWTHIEYPMLLAQSESPLYKSERGKLTIGGQQNDYSVNIKSDIATSILASKTQQSDFITAQVNLLGGGSRTAFKLNELSIKPKGNASTSYLMIVGDALFAEDFSSYKAALNINGESINPALFAKQWPGDLKTVMQLNVEQGQQGFSAIVDELMVEGQLRDYPVKVDAQANVNNQVINLKTFSLSSGNSYLTASGNFSPGSLNGQWDFNSDDLASLYPTATGLIEASGTVNGKLKQPIATANVDAKNITLGEVTIETIKANADIDLSSDNSESLIDIAINNINTNGFIIEDSSANLSGSLQQHRLSFAANTEQGDVEKKLSGRLLSTADDFQWQFLLEDFNVKPTHLEQWQLQKKVSGILSSDKAAIEPTCLKSNDNAFCFDVDASFSEQIISANMVIDQLNYRYFLPLVGQSDAFKIDQGSIAGTANIMLVENGLEKLQLDLLTQPATLQIPLNQSIETEETKRFSDLLPLTTTDPEPDERWVNFLLGQGKINARLINNNASIDIDFPINWHINETKLTHPEHIQSLAKDSYQGLKLVLNTQSVDANEPIVEQRIDGRLALNAYDLDPIIDLFPQVSAVPSENTKTLVATMDITGTLSAPELVGSLTLEHVALNIIEAGITLSDIQAQLSSDVGGTVQYQVQALSRVSQGDNTNNTIAQNNQQKMQALTTGQLLIDGDMRLQDPLFVTMSIEGNQFQAVNTPEASVVISPSLMLQGDQERLDITGSILVPTATIAPKAIPSSAVVASDDQVIISDEIETPQYTPDIYSDITLRLGDEVLVNSFGFKGNISGAIVAKTRPGSPTTGSGELAINDGEYRAYGQGLVIERGRIIFAGGNIEQPGIDIKAKRNPAPDITVGVLAQGDSREPDFTLFSEPTMTQTEQLSWLILGKPLNNSTAGEGNALNQLALSIGLASGDDFLQQFNGQLGIDSIAIETGSGEAGAYSDNEQAALTLGKYLTPKLYLSYGIGLFDALNTVKVEYLINNVLKLATESSSAASGADVIYNIGVQ